MVYLKKVLFKGQEIDINDLTVVWTETMSYGRETTFEDCLTEFASAKFSEGYDEGYAEAEENM